MKFGTPTKPGNGYAFGRVLLLFAALCGVGFATYFLNDSAVTRATGLVTLLFVLPYAIGALATLATGQFGQPSAVLVVSLTLAVLVVGGLVLREGMVCIAMLSLPWFFSALLGVVTVHRFRAIGTRKAHGSKVMSLGALPIIALFVEPVLPLKESVVVVSRAVEIDASAGEVWPVLLDMAAISEAEGRWTFAQSVLRVPRPNSALVIGNGVGARRLAEWGHKARFEEIVTHWEQPHTMAWRFDFPDDSIQRYTDRHVSPEGPFVHIEQGGYRLAPNDEGGTTLTLTTTYRIETPLNWYGRFWGEILLGDVQANVLHIVAERAESA